MYEAHAALSQPDPHAERILPTTMPGYRAGCPWEQIAVYGILAPRACDPDEMNAHSIDCGARFQHSEEGDRVSEVPSSHLAPGEEGDTGGGTCF